jgi:hypothetical protein
MITMRTARSFLAAFVLGALRTFGETTLATDTGTTNSPSRFRSAEDGCLDVSGFLDEKYGFLPIMMPITEPAVGYDAAWNHFERFDSVQNVVTGGFRYELARKYGIHSGLDVAGGPDNTAVYVQVGSAWVRP